MLLRAHYLKVLKAIVSFIVVAMVDKLVAQQSPSKVLLHHVPVLIYSPPLDCPAFIDVTHVSSAIIIDRIICAATGHTMLFPKALIILEPTPLGSSNCSLPAKK